MGVSYGKWCNGSYAMSHSTSISKDGNTYPCYETLLPFQFCGFFAFCFLWGFLRVTKLARTGSCNLDKKLNHPAKKLNNHARKGKYQILFMIGNNLHLLCFPVQLEHVFLLTTLTDMLCF